MLKYILLTAAMLAALSARGGERLENFVANGGFEDNENCPVASWEVSKFANQWACFLDPTTRSDGKRGLRISPPAGSVSVAPPKKGDIKLQMTQRLNDKRLAGRGVRISADIKPYEFEGTAKVMLRATLKDGQYNSYELKAEPHFTYRHVTGLWSIPAEIAAIELVIEVDGKGRAVWFDNIRVE